MAKKKFQLNNPTGGETDDITGVTTRVKHIGDKITVEIDDSRISDINKLKARGFTEQARGNPLV